MSAVSPTDFDALINTVCATHCTHAQRAAAEQRLLSLLSDPLSYTLYVPLLQHGDDTLVFFVSLALQRLVWRTQRDHTMCNTLCDAVQSALRVRGLSLSHFARSKVEQLLGTLCVQRESFEPALSLVYNEDNLPYIAELCRVDRQSGNGSGVAAHAAAAPAVALLVGLSALRTALELALCDDAKIDAPRQRRLAISLSASPLACNASSSPVMAALASLSLSLSLSVSLSPLAATARLAESLAHSVLYNYEQQQQASEQSVYKLKLCLDLLKVMVAKLPLGAHVSLSLLALLFDVAERSVSLSVYQQCAQISVEILFEIVQKRWLPSGGVSVLVQLTAHTVALLRRFREQGGMSDSALCLSLWDFISLFVEHHLERCVAQTHGLPPTRPDVAALNETLSLFLSELFAATLSTQSSALSCKLLSLWSELLSLDALSQYLVSERVVDLQSLAQRCLSLCLCESNAALAENTEELSKSARIEILADPCVREALGAALSLSPSLSLSLSLCLSDHASNGYESRCTSSVEENEEVRRGGAGEVEEEENEEVALWHAAHGALRSLCEHVVVADSLSLSVSQRIAQRWQDLGVVLQGFAHNTASSNVTCDIAGQTVSCNVSCNSFVLSERGREKERGAACVAAALDLLSLLRVAPALHRTSSARVQLAGNLLDMLNFLVNFAHTGEALMSLLAQCAQCVAALLQSERERNAWGGFAQTALFGVCDMLHEKTLVSMATTLSAERTHAAHASLPQFSVSLSLAVLALQSINACSDILQRDEGPIREQLQAKLRLTVSCVAHFAKTSVANDLQAPHTNLTKDMRRVRRGVELYALLCCALDLLESDKERESGACPVARQLVQDVTELHARTDVALASNDFATLAHNMETDGLRALTALIALTHTHSISRSNRRQQLLLALTPLQTQFSRTVESLLRVQHAVWSSHNVHSETLTQCVGLSLSLVRSLLQCLGRKSWGTVACESLSVTVSLIESVNAAHALSPYNPLTHSAGLTLLCDTLSLCVVLAESTPANTPSAVAQLSLSQRLLAQSLALLGDERVCAHLLQHVLHACCVSLRCYWSPAQRGENTLALTVSLTQLCVGALSVTHSHSEQDASQSAATQRLGVSPQDTRSALEGVLALHTQHALCDREWFCASDCWHALFGAILKALVIRSHSSHAPQLESLFTALCGGRLKTLPDVTQRIEFTQRVAQEIYQAASHATDTAHNELIHALLAHSLSQVAAAQGSLDGAVLLAELVNPVACELSRQA